MIIIIVAWNHKIVNKLLALDMNNWNYITVRKQIIIIIIIVTWNHKIVDRLLTFDRNTWNYITVCKQIIIIVK